MIFHSMASSSEINDELIHDIISFKRLKAKREEYNEEFNRSEAECRLLVDQYRRLAKFLCGTLEDVQKLGTLRRTYYIQPGLLLKQLLGTLLEYHEQTETAGSGILDNVTSAWIELLTKEICNRLPEEVAMHFCFMACFKKVLFDGKISKQSYALGEHLLKERAHYASNPVMYLEVCAQLDSHDEVDSAEFPARKQKPICSSSRKFTVSEERFRTRSLRTETDINSKGFAKYVRLHINGIIKIIELPAMINNIYLLRLSWTIWV